jgi:hypothetical protein
VDIQPQLQGALAGPGFQTVIFPRPSLPTPGNGIPVEFVIVSDMEIEELNGLADQLLGQAMGSGKFMFLPRTSSTPARAPPSISTATSPAISASACRPRPQSWRSC